MIGSYRILENGLVVAEGTNLITDLGKQAILRTLAGTDSTFAAAIAVGSLDTLPNAPASTDTTLGFEFGRAPITVRTQDYTTNDVIFKGTLPSGFAGKIYELGIYNKLTDTVAGRYASKLLASFESGEGWTSTSVNYDDVNNRVGSNSILCDITTASASQTYTTSDFSMDLSGYSVNDSIGLTFITYYDYVASIKIQFVNASGTVMEGTFTPATHTAGAGNPQVQLVKVLKSAFTNSGAEWGNINTMNAVVTAKGTASGTNRAKVALDGIAAFDNDTINPQFVLVTRAAVGPYTKSSSTPADIEYRIRFTI